MGVHFRPEYAANALSGSALVAESPEALLKRHMPLLQNLSAFTQLDETRFNQIYMELFRNLAAWCQHLPASERHHHAHLGGLLEHSIEVAVYSARIAGRFLYISDGEEQISQWQALYIFAMTSAGALHDIGKLLTDVDVVVMKGSNMTPWLPHLGPMAPGTKYIYRYNDRRQHGVHEVASLPLIFQIMPKAALSWIWKKSIIRDEWLATIGGKAMELGGNIGRCVIECDSQSTGDAMADAPVAVAAQATVNSSLAKRPQIHALAIKGITLSLRDFEPNKKNSPYWVSQHFIACVAPRFVECIRSALGTENQFLPDNTSLIYDTMGDNGMLILNVNGKAMHSLMFTPNQKPLAVVLVKRQVLDPDAKLPVYTGRLLCPSVDEQYHHQIPGEVKPAKTGSSTSDAKPIAKPAQSQVRSEQKATSTQTTPKIITAPDAKNPSMELQPQQHHEQVQPNLTGDQSFTEVAAKEEAGIVEYPLTVKTTSDEFKRFVQGTEAPGASQETQQSAAPSIKKSISGRSDTAHQFIEWLRAQIMTGALQVNARAGVVHIVSERRLCFVSPGLFYTFLDQNGANKNLDPKARREAVSKVQHAIASVLTFERSILGSTMITAEIVGMRKRADLHVMVLTAQGTEQLMLDLDFDNANRFITLGDIR
ncbi:TraI domain-containing protein (plasmid) [Aeromonas hydrophila]|uniref:TraI domain-containing protein n=1 Tax=Aeromonas sp. QDB39 TaxID=2989828 RepID=UPI0022E6DFE2|nr:MULTISPECIES: TraI domain-containing protein [Aeromonas]WEA32920.1 TraI domain-containing protein [Aeromonas hydrophila]